MGVDVTLHPAKKRSPMARVILGMKTQVRMGNMIFETEWMTKKAPPFCWRGTLLLNT
jgi:hypothetical protein